MRYVMKRDKSGTWGIWDVRRQSFFCEGLDATDARETVDKKNDENESEVKRILGVDVLPK